MRSVSFIPVFPPDLYIVEFSICVCGDVRFLGEQDFSLTTNTGEYGGAGYNKFWRVFCARISFSTCSSGDVSKTKLGGKNLSKYEGECEFVCVTVSANTVRTF